jgi:hypothetical protein
MNLKEFKQLPELLTRAQVVECGVPDNSVDDLRVKLTEDSQTVQFGQIGAVQLAGRNCRDRSKAKFRYRKSDVARICGYRLD